METLVGDFQANFINFPLWFFGQRQPLPLDEPNSNFHTLFFSKNIPTLRSPGLKVKLLLGYMWASWCAVVAPQLHGVYWVTCKIPRSNQKGCFGNKAITWDVPRKKENVGNMFSFRSPRLKLLKRFLLPHVCYPDWFKTFGFCSSIFRAEIFHGVPSIQRALSENTTPGGFHLKRCRPNNQQQLSLSQIVPCHKDHGGTLQPMEGWINLFFAGVYRSPK